MSSHPILPPDTIVTFTSYGEPRTGRVIRDNGTGVVRVETTNGTRWLHRESLTSSPSLET